MFAHGTDHSRGLFLVRLAEGDGHNTLSWHEEHLGDEIMVELARPIRAKSQSWDIGCGRCRAGLTWQRESRKNNSEKDRPTPQLSKASDEAPSPNTAAPAGLCAIPDNGQ
jgi:hypothetical protein